MPDLLHLVKRDLTKTPIHNWSYEGSFVARETYSHPDYEYKITVSQALEEAWLSDYGEFSGEVSRKSFFSFILDQLRAHADAEKKNNLNRMKDRALSIFPNADLVIHEPRLNQYPVFEFTVEMSKLVKIQHV